VGSWTATNPKGLTSTTDFTDKGEITSASDVRGVKATAKGTYSLNGDDLTISYQSLQSVAADPKVQKFLDKERPRIEEQLKRSRTGKIVWKDSDDFTLTGSEGEWKYTRKKG
jgi:hypothetical protein